MNRTFKAIVHNGKRAYVATYKSSHIFNTRARRQDLIASLYKDAGLKARGYQILRML